MHTAGDVYWEILDLVKKELAEVRYEKIIVELLLYHNSLSF
jgi:hypothetical protein